jgi:chemotaxis protein MotB
MVIILADSAASADALADGATTVDAAQSTRDAAGAEAPARTSGPALPAAIEGVH